MKTYDPKKYDIVYAGIRLDRGLADGTFLSISAMSPGFSSKVGVDGEVVRTRSHDTRRTVSFTTMQTSELNDRLSAVYDRDRRAPAGEGVGSFVVQDRNGTTLIEGTAYIVQDPDLELSNEASTREWKLELVDVGTFRHGSNLST
jgi:hypothetical protein